MVELYAPPSVNYGMIYPPAILVFIFTLTDSVISPLILIFGAIYFAVGCEASRYLVESANADTRTFSLQIWYTSTSSYMVRFFAIALRQS
jgi:hypothetical protein